MTSGKAVILLREIVAEIMGVVADVAYLRISKVSIYISSPQGLVWYHGPFDIDYHFKLKE